MLPVGLQHSVAGRRVGWTMVAGRVASGVAGRAAGVVVLVVLAGCSLGRDPVATATLEAPPPPPAAAESPRPAPTRAPEQPDPTAAARRPPRPVAGRTPAASARPAATSPEAVAAFCVERERSEPVLLGLVAAASGGYGGDGRLDPALGGPAPATLADLVTALEGFRDGAPPEAAADLDQVLAALADGPPDDTDAAALLDAANRLLGSLAATCP